jgi:hypothetical protein
MTTAPSSATWPPWNTAVQCAPGKPVANPPTIGAPGYSPSSLAIRLAMSVLNGSASSTMP